MLITGEEYLLYSLTHNKIGDGLREQTVPAASDKVRFTWLHLEETMIN